MEVRFESRSGKTATAISKANGDAIVAMPKGEQWARSGLRRAGSNDKWVWIDIPAERAKARIGGFAMTNLREIHPPPFKSLTLIQRKGKLVIDDASFGICGRYERKDILNKISAFFAFPEREGRFSGGLSDDLQRGFA